MFVVTRLRVAEQDAEALAGQVATLLTALAARPGFVDGRWGQAPDDPSLWALLSRWDDVGSYRRALSAAEVKIAGAPVWVHAVDEPGVYLDPQDVAPGAGRRPEDLLSSPAAAGERPTTMEAPR